jgi:hypothetical protein
VKSFEKIEEVPVKDDNVPVVGEQNLNSLIENILNSLEKTKKWTLEETVKLL